MAVNQELAPVVSALAILRDFNTGRIKEVLLALPETIKVRKGLANAARQALKDAEALRAEREAELRFEVSTAIDEAGKKKYGNDEARNSELLRRKAQDPDYLWRHDQVVRTQQDLDAAQDDYQQAVDSFRAYGAVASLVESELGLYARLGIGKPQERQAF